MSNQRTFTQIEVNEMMERHRKGLQAKILNQEAVIETLTAKVAELSDIEANPVALMILTALEKVKNHV